MSIDKVRIDLDIRRHAKETNFLRTWGERWLRWQCLESKVVIDWNANIESFSDHDFMTSCVTCRCPLYFDFRLRMSPYSSPSQENNQERIQWMVVS